MDENDEEKREIDKPKDIKTVFDHYAKFEDKKSDGTITLNSIEMWMAHAEISKKCDINEQDIAETFLEIAKNKERLNFSEFQGFLVVLSGKKKMDVQDVTKHLIAKNPPQTNGFIPRMKDSQSAHKESVGNYANCDWDFLYNIEKGGEGKEEDEEDIR
ncbi:hypothetical protein TNCT_607621 [Trichonephila clavata]|uniref:EF-hand domain-containing protein n=1 Tax=Trichonephila clavata TaxID=2740835 RepID=A0A8X6LWH6_TRICU|nr:hypothetical protein TNCT_193611 [Trichonephila clavata]GFR28245.1 hypothetical protein TNCT_607621 [Trichonephila clavata]